MPHAHASDDSTRRRSSASARARPYPLPEATLPLRLSSSPSSSSRRAETSGAPSTSRRPPLAFPPRFHSPEPIRLAPKLRSLSTSPTEPVPGRIGPAPRHGRYGHEPSAKPPLPCSAAVAVAGHPKLMCRASASHCAPRMPFARLISVPLRCAVDRPRRWQERRSPWLPFALHVEPFLRFSSARIKAVVSSLSTPSSSLAPSPTYIGCPLTEMTAPSQLELLLRRCPPTDHL